MDLLATALRNAIDTGATTVVHLSNATGLSRVQIYRIMNGESSPSLKNAEKLASEIGLQLTLETSK